MRIGTGTHRTWIAIALATVLLGVGWAAAQGEAAKPKMPANFTFTQGEKSPGVVTFSHDAHFAKTPKCADCHVKAGFKMKKGTTVGTTMAAMNEGKLCGTCHNGTTSFSTKDEANCTKCHAKT